MIEGAEQIVPYLLRDRAEMHQRQRTPGFGQVARMERPGHVGDVLVTHAIHDFMEKGTEYRRIHVVDLDLWRQHQPDLGVRHAGKHAHARAEAQRGDRGEQRRAPPLATDGRVVDGDIADYEIIRRPAHRDPWRGAITTRRFGSSPTLLVTTHGLFCNVR
jgi:hypothetical protein